MSFVQSSGPSRGHSSPNGKLIISLLIFLAVLLVTGCSGRAAEAAPLGDAVETEVNSVEMASTSADDSESAAGEAVAGSAEGSVATEASGGDGSLIESVAAATAPKAIEPLAVGAFASKALYPPDRLELPSINLDTPVIELGWSARTLDTGEIYSEWEDAADAAGWHKNSQRPGFGGNVVLSGHNNILGAVFRELDLLKRGDTAYLYVDHQKFEYVIDKVLIVPEKFATEEQRQKNFSYIEQTDDERLTLVSCWPRDDNTHRIIVVARPVESSVIN